MGSIPWEKQIGREADWWATHKTKNLAIQAHVDYFEHIYFTYARYLHGKTFGTVLEIGTGGSGGYLSVMPGLGKKIALDPIVDELREIGMLPYASHIRYVKGFAEEMPFGSNSFDLVIASNALDHVRDMNKSLAEIKRVLKQGGLFFFFTFLNVNPPHPWTFETARDVLEFMKDFKLLEGHAMTTNYSMRRNRNPFFVATFQKVKQE